MANVLLYSGSSSRDRVSSALSAVRDALGEFSAAVLAPRADGPCPATGEQSLASLVEVGCLEYTHLVLDDPEDDDPNVEFLLDDALSRPLQGIHCWNPGSKLSVFAPHEGKVASVLNVFPGMPFPVRMGSQRRVCELTRHLNRAGVPVDLLVRKSNDVHAPDVLRAIAPQVRAYARPKVRLSPQAGLRRSVEKFARRVKGTTSKAPELFSERMDLQASRADIRALREALETGQYDTVILNYAWLIGIMRALPDDLRRSVRWLCDTHDVQFVRNATANVGQWRFAVDFAQEKRAEVDALAAFDTLIAISVSDAAELSEVVEPSKVLLAPTGFDYASVPRSAKWPADLAAPRFGFLGGPMHANAAAVERLVREWWPCVREAWPDSTLVIAGAVSRRGDVRDMCFLEEGIQLLGFVPSLTGYYESIDVALSPVVVQGGLNFKSVEPLMAGVLLVTTPMGAACLGEGAPALVVESGEEMVRELRSVFDRAARGEHPTEDACVWARDRFGNHTSYARLTESLRGG